MSSDLPPARDEFQELLRQAREKVPGACQQLYDRYRHHVLRVVRRSMDPRLRTRYDSIDLTQNVWASVFGHGLAEHDFSSPEGFLRFPTAVTENKANQLYRREIATQKRSLSREEPIGQHGS
jgi:DNA-directed RNA polymerase specialized sigma24 family protein